MEMKPLSLTPIAGSGEQLENLQNEDWKFTSAEVNFFMVNKISNENIQLNVIVLNIIDGNCYY